MRSMKRRLLSLFMAMVMVCSLVPAALAEEDDNGWTIGEPTWEGGKPEGLPDHTHDWQIVGTAKDPTCTAKGERKYTCNYSYTVDVTENGETKKVSKTCGATRTDTAEMVEHTPVTDPSKPADYVAESNGHFIKCSVCGGKTGTVEEHTFGATTGKCTVCNFVNPNPTLAGITLSSEELNLKVGETAKLTVKPVPAGATIEDGVSWSNSNDDAVSLSTSGSVEALAIGESTITAMVGEFTASCAVKVTAADLKLSVSSSEGSTLNPGNKTNLTASLPTGSGKTIKSVTWTADPTGKISIDGTSATAVATVSDSAATGNVVIKAVATLEDDTTAEGTLTVKIENAFSIGRVGTSSTLTSMDSEIELYPMFNGEEYKDGSVAWSITNGTYFNGRSSQTNNRYFVTPETASSTQQSATVTATAKIDGQTYTAKATVYLKFSAEISLTATVSSDYYLGDVSDKGSYSVKEQLDRAISAISKSRTLSHIVFSNVTSDYGDLDVRRNEKIDDEDIADILFTPEKKGSAVFSFTAYSYTTDPKSTTEHSGVLTITVTDATSGGDVVFYGDVGEEVYLDSADFEDFWDEKFPSGDLDYVTFGSVSGGSLLDEDDKSAGSKQFYVSPKRSELDLDEVHFKPNSSNSKKAVTISFSFTAYGENKSGSDKTATGTVQIVYMSASPKDISYSVGSNGTVSLKASDFTAAYKEAVGSTAPSTLTIVFQNAPSNGTLKYTDSSKKNASTVTLTNSNIKSRSFTTKSSGTNQIGDVTYTGSASKKDTIEYIAYSGSTPKFKGSVVFGGSSVSQSITVPFTSTNGQAVAFTQSAFITAESTLANATKIRFAASSNGSLMLNGTTNAAGIDLLMTQLNSVTYTPKAGFNGQDKIVFMAYDANNTLVGSGNVVVIVAGNTTTTTPGGVNDASKFVDVPSNAWYFANLSTLVSKGIITGRGNGNFDPLGTVTYGEALKMILEAAGYTAAVGTGNDWAINYKNLAVANGWISSDISLTAPISRNATAELAARVLGVAPSSSASPFADEANAYAVALYYTTPQIFAGSANPNGGKPLFCNNEPLLRQQVCAVICRVMDYHLAHSAAGNTMPDGI